MNQVFISYVDDNKDFVKDLVDALEQADFPNWYDSVALRTSNNWQEVIDTALRNSFAIIIVLSPTASASVVVQYEWAFARGRNIKIIPVLYKPTEIAPEFDLQENYIDLTNRKQLTLNDFNDIVHEVHQAYLAQNTLASSPEHASSSATAPVAAIKPTNFDNIPHQVQNNNPSDEPSPILGLPTYNYPPEPETKNNTNHSSNGHDTSLRIWLREAIVNLKRGDSRQRADAAGLLGELGNDSAVQPLLGALNDSHTKVRKAVAIALGKLKNSNAVPGLIGILENKTGDIDLREAAANALCEIRDPSAVPALIDALIDDPEMYVRLTAAKGLGLIGDPAAVPPLVDTMLNVRWHLLRRAAVWALGEIGEVTILADLLDALNDDDEQVRREAALVTIKIWKPHALKEALWHRDWRVREAAVWAYGQAKYVGVVPDLVELLYDEERNVRLSVVKALGHIGDHQAVPELLQCIQIERDDQVLLLCINALGIINSAEAVDTLTDCLFIKGDDSIREAAAIALGKIGHHSALDKLRLSLDHDPSSIVQIALIEAIAQIHHPDVVPILVRALSYEDASVRHAAAKSLQMIGSPAALEALSKWYSRNPNNNF